jgi:hypothetical protein
VPGVDFAASSDLLLCLLEGEAVTAPLPRRNGRYCSRAVAAAARRPMQQRHKMSGSCTMHCCQHHSWTGSAAAPCCHIIYTAHSLLYGSMAAFIIVVLCEPWKTGEYLLRSAAPGAGTTLWTGNTRSPSNATCVASQEKPRLRRKRRCKQHTKLLPAISSQGMARLSNNMMYPADARPTSHSSSSTWRPLPQARV